MFNNIYVVFFIFINILIGISYINYINIALENIQEKNFLNKAKIFNKK
jgi:hypothetical protein